MLHYGGVFTSENSIFGTIYKYDGGDVYDLGTTFGGGLKFEHLLKMMRTVFATKGAKNLTVYVLNDGIRSRVDDDDDLDFQWQILPVDEGGYIHFFCVNGETASSTATVSVPPKGNSPFMQYLTTKTSKETNNENKKKASPVKKLPVKRKLDGILHEAETNNVNMELIVDLTEYFTQQTQGKF